MSTFNYAKTRAGTLKLLKKFGNDLTLIREESGSTYNPVDGTFGGGATANILGTGVLLGYNQNEINNETILATDRKLLFQGDTLAIGDAYNDWRVFSIGNLDPDESGVILTTAQMRK